jgi:eight-cysteine-cluster-containing protein
MKSASLAATLLLFACSGSTATEDAGSRSDAGTDASSVLDPDSGSTQDAGTDAGSNIDATVPPDAGSDAGSDSGPREVGCGARLGDTCTTSEYCDFPTSLCGRADGTGICRPRPVECGSDANPVCGCNGETYANECSAYIAGVDVSSTGTCPTTTTCMATGCSGEICATDPRSSLCIWRDWYECLALTMCEAQPDGACGWTPNAEFNACLEERGGGG